MHFNAPYFRQEFAEQLFQKENIENISKNMLIRLNLPELLTSGDFEGEDYLPNFTKISAPHRSSKRTSSFAVFRRGIKELELTKFIEGISSEI